MDDPEIAVFLILDEPMGKEYYGGTICTTVVGNMMAEILPYLGYEPQYTDAELASMAIKVPDITGKDVAAAKAVISNAGLTAIVVGNGDKVISQMPDSTQSIFKKGTVILYTEEEVSAERSTVTNFLGLTASGVNELAVRNGINVQFSGTSITVSGVTAYKQSIAAGTEVEKGTTVTVEFRDSTLRD